MQSNTVKLFALFASTTLAFIASVRFGQTTVTWNDVWSAFFAFEAESVEQTIIRTNRLSRAIVALVVGAALGTAGVLSQTLTRNALASPTTLGLNSGALFAIALGLAFVDYDSLFALMMLGFTGAALAVVAVYGLAATNSVISPIRLILSGTVISALLISLTQGLLIFDQRNLAGIVYWLGGSVAGRDTIAVVYYAPIVIVGFTYALLNSNNLNLLLLPDDLAKGLGQSITRTRVFVAITIVAMAGGAVAIAGVIAFIGLAVPHIARKWVNTDHRILLPTSALVGASLLLVADTLSRFIAPPQEIPTGVMTSMVGVPILAYLISKKRFNL